MVAMVSSVYEDVCLQGCAAIAKLAATYECSRHSMAASLPLMAALVKVVGSESLSVAACATAALAVQELTYVNAGRACFAACPTDLLTAFVKNAGVSGADLENLGYDCWFLQRYWYVF